MSTSGKIKDIEVLRAFAVMSVVLHHLNGSLYRFKADSTMGTFYNYFSGGVGVDLFFAISGFVIARSLLPRFSGELDRQQYKNIAFSFWLRRATRLLPSAWLWLAIILILTIGFNESGVFGTLRTNVEASIAAILQIANVRFADGFGQYALGASFVYWSLSLEEQFYIVFPFIALLARRKLIALLVIVICLQLFQPRGLWHMMFRTDAICFGVLIAMMQSTFFYRKLANFVDSNVLFASLILAVSLILLFVVGSKQFSIPYYYLSAVSVLSFIAVFIASFNADTTAKILPLHGVLVWIGARSYALYLVHIPVFYLMRELCFRLNVSIPLYLPIVVPISLMLMAICAELNFRYIEDPIRRWGSNLASRKFDQSAPAIPTTVG